MEEISARWTKDEARALVEDGLRALIRQKQRRKILSLAGKID